MKGNITIGRYSSGNIMFIELRDEASSTLFCKVKTTTNDLMLALTGLGFVDVEFELTAANVGKRHQHKTEEVFVPESAFSKREKVAAAAVRALENDGWVGRVEDALNHHCYIRGAEGGGIYRVVYYRWV